MIDLKPKGIDEIVKDLNSMSKIELNAKLIYLVQNPNNIKFIPLLIKAGADINTKLHNWTPLIFAIVSGHESMVYLLINFCANVNMKFNYDRTPLMFASKYGNKQIVHALIKAGANINAIDENGETALFNAIFYKRGEVVELLKKCGAK